MRLLGNERRHHLPQRRQIGLRDAAVVYVARGAGVDRGLVHGCLLTESEPNLWTQRAQRAAREHREISPRIPSLLVGEGFTLTPTLSRQGRGSVHQDSVLFGVLVSFSVFLSGPRLVLAK